MTMTTSRPYRHRRIGSYDVTWYEDGSIELFDEPHDTCATLTAEELSEIRGWAIADEGRKRKEGDASMFNGDDPSRK